MKQTIMVKSLKINTEIKVPDRNEEINSKTNFPHICNSYGIRYNNYVTDGLKDFQLIASKS